MRKSYSLSKQSDIHGCELDHLKFLFFFLFFQQFCRKATTDEDEPIEMEFVQRNRRQSLIGSTVEQSDGNTRRMSLIGSTIGKDSSEKLPVVTQVIDEED